MHARVTSVGLLVPQDPADTFVYPDHIDRASLDALPSRPGVYVFRDECDRPLYIGKSINLRSRVLAHLRTPEEARMLQQSRRVDFTRTAGEIGALLLEARLIKQLQPLHNKKLRRTREMCTLRLADTSAAIPEIVHGREIDFSCTTGLYGLFATRKAALERLRALVDEHRLCPALSGLERTARGRTCFSHQIGRCMGACAGKESVLEHHERLRRALEDMRVVVWPFAGPVGIVEECDGWCQTHLVDHWFYLGSFDRGRSAANGWKAGRRSRGGFDVDTYKILVRPMLEGRLQIELSPGG